MNTLTIRSQLDWSVNSLQIFAPFPDCSNLNTLEFIMGVDKSPESKLPFFQDTRGSKF